MSEQFEGSMRRVRAAPFEEIGKGSALSGASVSGCLREIKILVQDAWEPNLRLRVQAPTDLPMVRCDRLGLRDALLNLVFNARDAMPAGGLVSITAADASRHSSGTEIELRVTDEGVGMTPDTMARALDPFFTTKSTGLGGLGLPLVERFVRDISGRLEIESSLGLGTMVTLRLPTLEKA